MFHNDYNKGIEVTLIEFVDLLAILHGILKRLIHGIL